MTFSQILDRIKEGRKVYRSGWNDKNVYLYYIVFGQIKGELCTYLKQPFIAMKDTKGDIVPWQPSQIDILSDDWEVTN